MNDKLREAITKLVGAKRRLVAVYGGALHNDLHPVAALAPFTFGRAIQKLTRDRYLEIDLYLPELAESDMREAATRPVAAFLAAEKSAPGRTLVVRRGPRSYVVFLPRRPASPR